MASSQAQQRVLEIELPNGRAPNIYTEEGALEFIRFQPKWVTNGMPILKTGGREMHIDDPERDICHILAEVPNALNGKHADKLALSEYEAVAKFYEGLYKDLAATTKWREEGVLGLCDMELFHGIVPWALYPIFVREMVPRGFRSLAIMLGSARCFPDPDMATIILRAVHNAHQVLVNMSAADAERWNMTEFLEAPAYSLEKTGIVAQAFRLLLTPSVNTNEFLSGILAGILREDRQLCYKRFAPGKSSAKTLNGLLKGTDPWLLRKGDDNAAQEDKTMILSKLQVLQDVSQMVGSSRIHTTTTCRHCKKFPDIVRQCSRCKGAVYCSRECQKADWKNHKRLCTISANSEGSGASRLSSSLNPEIILWARKHWPEICDEMIRMRSTHSVSQKELVVEIDLKASSDPDVLIKPFSVYVAGNKAGPGMPDWGRSRQDPNFIIGLRETHNRCTDQKLMIVHRGIDADYGVVCLDLHLRGT